MGGPGKPPFWRTREEFCKELGSVTSKINTQHTQVKTGISALPGCDKVQWGLSFCSG